ncbi:hypothetical protein I3760_08G110100 [Carya illinoinensis]|nr:hypothetical protein I3760_08G110100 [Carya illinoinensis]
MGWWRSYASDERFSSSTLTVSIGIFEVLWLLWVIKKQRKAVPIVGYLPFIATELHTKFEQLGGIYGPIYKIWLANKLCIVISSPSLVKEVVRDHDAIFANRDATKAALAITSGGVDIVFSPNGPNWRMLRKMFVREMLSLANLDSTFALQREEVRNTIINLAFVTSMNTIMKLLWGSTLQGEEGAKLGDEFRHMFLDLMLLLGKPKVSDLFPTLASFDLQGIVREVKIKSLAKAKEEGKPKTGQKDFLQILLEIWEKDKGANLISMTQLKVVLLDIVVAASDTTTTMSEWVMARLMKHSETMRKVHEELTEIVGMDNLVEESHLPKLHYLDAVIKETLRLRPPIPFLIPCTPSESSIIGGYHVPKGSRIFVNVWAIQRNPNYWDNPLEFKPKRFLNDGYGRFAYLGNNFKYFPFGLGRRICAGITLGDKTLKYILASILHSFEWKFPRGSKIDVSDTFGIITKKKNPTIAIPTPRLSKFELYT